MFISITGNQIYRHSTITINRKGSILYQITVEEGTFHYHHWATTRTKFKISSNQSGSLVVGALDFLPEGQWFEVWSLPLCYFLRQETLLHLVSLHPGVQMGTSDIMLGVTGLASHPGGVVILSVP